MDHPFYWDNALLSPVDTQTLPDYLFSPSDINIDYQNEAAQDNERLSIWTSFDPNAGEFQENQGGHDESRIEDGWNATLSINSADVPRMEDQHFERSSVLSLENMDLNLNTVADERPLLPQTLNVSQSCLQSADAKNVDTHSEIAENEAHYRISELFEPKHVLSSNSHGSSSSGDGIVFGVSAEGLDYAKEGQRIACKRKNFERVIGESSASVNTLFIQQNGRNYKKPSSLCHSTAENSNAPSSSRLLLIANSLEKQPKPNSRANGGISSECDPCSSVTGNAENLQRNFRVRLNPEEQHDISHTTIPIPCNSNLSSIGSLNEPSCHLSHPNLTLGETQSCIPPIPYLPGHVFSSMNGASSSRGGSSSSSGKLKKSLIDSFDEENMRNIPRSGIPDYPTFLIGTNSSHLRQGPPNGNPYTASMTMTGNLAMTSRASSSSGINSLPGLISVRHEISSVQNPRGHSPSSQEHGEPSGIGPPARPRYIRPSLLMERQCDGMPGIPLSIRNREGRDRMISEIRNALDLMRRGENFRFEDAFIRDHSAFFGRVDLHDRHRDMRLDVDSMSYEELLALEDKIGYVSTGLSEDAILNNLSQHKHSLCKLDLESAELEPCCICREEYCEGEDIGKLGCCHDFHAACIKQWLMIKNLCPICKTTALVT